MGPLLIIAQLISGFYGGVELAVGSYATGFALIMLSLILGHFGWTLAFTS